MTPSILPKLWQNGLRAMAITMPWPQSHREFVGRTEKTCASKEAYKPDSVTPALFKRKGPKFTQLIVGILWKATRNVWLKLNNLKAMLPNTNSVYCKLLTHWECKERNKSWNKITFSTIILTFHILKIKWWSYLI
jgi:hypothetical protein